MRVKESRQAQNASGKRAGSGRAYYFQGDAGGVRGVGRWHVIQDTNIPIPSAVPPHLLSPSTRWMLLTADTAASRHLDKGNANLPESMMSRRPRGSAVVHGTCCPRCTQEWITHTRTQPGAVREGEHAFRISPPAQHDTRTCRQKKHGSRHLIAEYIHTQTHTCTTSQASKEQDTHQNMRPEVTHCQIKEAQACGVRRHGCRQ